MKNKRSLLKTSLTIIAIILAFTAVALLLTNKAAPDEIPLWGNDTDVVSLQSLLEGNHIDEILVDGDIAYIKLKGNTTAEHDKLMRGEADYIIKIISPVLFDKAFTSIMDKSPGIISPKVTLYDSASAQQWTSYIIPVLGLVLLAVFMFFIFRQSTGANTKALNFTKSKAKLNSNIKVRFTDVAGAEEEKEELAEIVDFLRNSKKFSDVGAKIPKGILLVGPPGTGKTLFAKAVAGEAKVPFFSISGSDFVEMFVGTGAARVRDLFNQAKKNKPCIVFIDEIDAVGRKRGAGLGGGNDEKEQTLNQLLVEMDGFDDEEGVIILAATNRADVLDPALTRPGRFDRQIFIHPPDVKGREEILKVHARNKPISKDISFKIIARMTVGFTGADLENLLNESAILAARQNRKIITMEDILEGINKVIAGPKKKSRIVTASDKRITAYHESGHAIVAKLLEHCDEVQEVSIVPRGMAAGYTLTRPDNDDSHLSKNKINHTIAMMLAGRAAEALVIKDITTGASSDIERATGLARKMVASWGMSEKFGNVYLGGEQEVFLGKDYAMHTNISDNTSAMVDQEIQRIIDENYKLAFSLLEDNREILENMVKVLFARDTIYTNEVNMLFEGKSADDVIKHIDMKGLSAKSSAFPDLKIVDSPSTENEKE